LLAVRSKVMAKVASEERIDLYIANIARFNGSWTETRRRSLSWRVNFVRFVGDAGGNDGRKFALIDVFDSNVLRFRKWYTCVLESTPVDLARYCRRYALSRLRVSHECRSTIELVCAIRTLCTRVSWRLFDGTKPGF